MANFVISTDAHVGDDGDSGWAFVAHGDGLSLHENGPLPKGPSHLAEWRAMAEALRWAMDALAAGDELDLHTDSALVAKGLAARKPAMSGEAAELRAHCRMTLARLGEAGIRVRVRRIQRSANAEADQLARQASHEIVPHGAGPQGRKV